jgi:hypothetical protein
VDALLRTGQGNIPIPRTPSVNPARALASPRLSPSTHQALIAAWGTDESFLRASNNLLVRPAEGRKGGYGAGDVLFGSEGVMGSILSWSGGRC